jgi:hypothetical protein
MARLMAGAVLIGHALGFGAAAVLSVPIAGSGSSPVWVVVWAVVGMSVLLAGYGVLQSMEAARFVGIVFLVSMLSIYLLAAVSLALALRSPNEGGGIPLWFTTLSPAQSLVLVGVLASVSAIGAWALRKPWRKSVMGAVRPTKANAVIVGALI